MPSRFNCRFRFTIIYMFGVEVFKLLLFVVVLQRRNLRVEKMLQPERGACIKSLRE